VTADLTLTPGGRNYQSDTYAKTSTCNATFSAVYDETETYQKTRYSSAFVLLFAGLAVGAVVAGTHKQRRLCLAGDCMNENDPAMEGHFATMESDNGHVAQDALEMASTKLESSEPAARQGIMRKMLNAVRV
jgi:hypothetical protein